MRSYIFNILAVCMRSFKETKMAYLVESDDGFIRPWLLSSQTLFANSFPMEDITLMSSIGQSSRSSDRTRDRCVPRFRCIPEHSIHIRAPRFKLAQSGSIEIQNKQSSGRGKNTRTKYLRYMLCYIWNCWALWITILIWETKGNICVSCSQHCWES